MRNITLLILGAINLVAIIPYVVDTYRRKTKPALATWSTWALVNGVAATSAIAAGHAFNTVVLASSYFVGTFAVLALALTRGTRAYTLFDGACQLLAIAGVVLWVLAKNPNVAVAFAVVVDVLAALPSFRHARAHPREETWITFYIAGVVSIGIVACASSFSFAALAYPLDNVIVNLGLVSVILTGRRRGKRTKQKATKRKQTAEVRQT